MQLADKYGDPFLVFHWALGTSKTTLCGNHRMVVTTGWQHFDKMADGIYRVNLRPYVAASQVAELAEEIFGLKLKDPCSFEELESYDDRNYLIKSKKLKSDSGEPGLFAEDCQLSSENFVLKVLHPKNTYAEGFLEATVQSLEHLHKNRSAARQIQFPENVRTLSGGFLHLTEFNVSLDYLSGKDANLYDLIKKMKATGDDVWRVAVDEHGQIFIKIKLYVRLLTYVPGKPLLHYTITDDLLFEVGVLSGMISKELESFSHPSLISKKDIWDLKNLLQLNSAKYLDPVEDETKKTLLQTGLELFDKNFLAVADKLPQQTIHSDINEGNILVSEIDGTVTVSGLVDFGDLTYSYRAFEVGITMAYMAILRPDDSIKSAGIVLSGYLSVSPLSNLEKSILYYIFISRIVQSLIIGNYTYTLNPENSYVLRSSAMGFKVLETFLKSKDNVNEIYDVWYKQCK